MVLRHADLTNYLATHPNGHSSSLTWWTSYVSVLVQLSHCKHWRRDPSRNLPKLRVVPILIMLCGFAVPCNAAACTRLTVSSGHLHHAHSQRNGEKTGGRIFNYDDHNNHDDCELRSRTTTSFARSQTKAHWEGKPKDLQHSTVVGRPEQRGRASRVPHSNSN